MTKQSMVVLSGVSKRFQEGGGERAVLQGVDATIARGEFVAVRGRSGSGKTTPGWTCRMPAKSTWTGRR